MIVLTRLNGEELMLNAFQIETVDQVPDTQVSMANGRKFFVQETPDDIRDRMRVFLRSVITGNV